MTTDRLEAAELAATEAVVDAWLGDQLINNPLVADVQRGDDDHRRWYVRVLGEQKDTFSIWFTLRERTLQYETYVMPAPEENEQLFYDHLLARNMRFNGFAFAIGEEHAVFLVGHLPARFVDEHELDRILGSLYAAVEQCFRPALRIGFATRFGR